jgi:acyl-CoA reductase-like NAD-dependent aldehyde dehydrogenase
MAEMFAPAECKVAHPDSFFIDGKWVKAAGSRAFDVISPSTETLVARVPEASAEEIDRAVRAAHAAFVAGPWPKTSPAERAALLRKLAAALRARSPELQLAATLQMGAPSLYTAGGVEYPALLMEKNADLIEGMELESVRERQGGVSIVVREPVGVVAAIAPWNTPLMLAGVKVAHALASGCTLVLKPAPETPLEALILAECAEEVGLPAGVLNVIQAGRETGELLVRHPLVDKVAFTGSTAAGKRIAGICAERVARVSLELGGKSAAVVLDDMLPQDVLPAFVPSAMFLSGQACACVTRLLVPRRLKSQYEEALVAAIAQLAVGDPFDPATFIGPVALERQRTRVEGYIAKGRDEGARLLTGGGRPKHLERGYYVEPTLFSNVTNDMVIAREEIFGPVLSLLTYDSEDEAIALANDSDFGLNGAVYTKDADKAYALMRRVRAGNMTHNGWTTDPDCPFGGFKQSGIGREQGPEGLAGYFEYKSVYMAALPGHLA